MFKRRPSFSSPRLASSTLVHDPPIQKMEKMEQSVQHVDDVAVISCCPRSNLQIPWMLCLHNVGDIGKP